MSIILIVVLLLFVLLFSLKNSQVIPVDLFFTRMNLSLSLIIFVSLIIGLLIMGVFMLVKTYKMKRRLKELESTNRNLLKENETLKARSSIRESEIRSSVRENESVKVDMSNLKEKEFSNINTKSRERKTLTDELKATTDKISIKDIKNV